jgi:hypothetical protein
MRIYLLCILSISTHLCKFGIETKVESKQGVTEGLTYWPKLGLVMCTKSFQTNANG